MAQAIVTKSALDLHNEGYHVRLLPKGGESSSYYELRHPDGQITELRDHWDPPGTYPMTVSIIKGPSNVPFDCKDYNQAINVLYPLQRISAGQ